MSHLFPTLILVDQTLRHNFQNLLKLFRVDDDATAVSKNNPAMIKLIEVFRNLLTRGTDTAKFKVFPLTLIPQSHYALRCEPFEDCTIGSIKPKTLIELFSATSYEAFLRAYVAVFHPSRAFPRPTDRTPSAGALHVFLAEPPR
jgi:hypothetical protein